MKAIVYTQYGPPEVLRVVDVPKPAPRDHEVLVKVHATTVTIGDTIMRSFKLSNIKIHGASDPGMAQAQASHPWYGAGQGIESIGRKVTCFKRGDRAFASTYGINFCGHAEYICLPENGVIAFKGSRLRSARVFAQHPAKGRPRRDTTEVLPIHTRIMRILIGPHTGDAAIARHANSSSARRRPSVGHAGSVTDLRQAAPR